MALRATKYDEDAALPFVGQAIRLSRRARTGESPVPHRVFRGVPDGPRRVTKGDEDAGRCGADTRVRRVGTPADVSWRARVGRVFRGVPDGPRRVTKGDEDAGRCGADTRVRRVGPPADVCRVVRWGIFRGVPDGPRRATKGDEDAGR